MKIRPQRDMPALKTEKRSIKLIGGSEDYCASCLGYRRREGKIEPVLVMGRSPGNLIIPSVQRVERVNSPGYSFAMTDLGDVYLINTANFFNFSTLLGNFDMVNVFAGFPMYGEKRVFAVVGKQKIVLVKTLDDRDEYSMPLAVRCGCFHADRMFVCDYDDGYLIRWSGTTLSDWRKSADGAGSITLDMQLGEVLNMYSFRDRVVLLREYGITVLRALGDPRNYTVDRNLVTSFNCAVKSPFAVGCAGKLFFCTDSAIYSFDGSSLSTLDIDLREKPYAFRRPAAFEDRYVYCECHSSASSKACLLEYDLDTGSAALFGENCVNFWRDNAGAFCFNGGYLASDLYDGGDVGRWTSRPIELETGRTKTLKSLSVSGSGQIELTVTADGVSRTFTNFGQLRADMRGRSFTFAICGNCSVDELVAEWEVTK